MRGGGDRLPGNESRRVQPVGDHATMLIGGDMLDEDGLVRHGVRHGHGRERPSQLSLVRRRRGLIIQKTRGGTIP